MNYHREDRYIVIKRKDLDGIPDHLRHEIVNAIKAAELPQRDFVVVESDWPEYHLVWAMLEHRMAGKPVPDFNACRHADELQHRLTAAEQRNAELLSAMEMMADNSDDRNVVEICRNYLKPTESGASE